MLRTLNEKARRALRRLWEEQPVRFTSWVVSALAGAGIYLTTDELAPVLAAIIPVLYGARRVRRRVYSPATVQKAAEEAKLQGPCGLGADEDT